MIEVEGLRALILETYGAGNAPTDTWFIKALKYAIEQKDLIIFNVTQCKGGSVEIGKYETSIELGKIGVVGGYDITTESAIAKLMYLLGSGYTKKEIERLLQIPLRGEMSII